MKQQLVDAAALVAWCAVIYLLSDQPALPMPQLFPHQDKLHHFIAYAVMGALAFRAMRHRLHGNALWLAGVIFCSLYGVSDEYHQSFVPGRMSEVADWLADTLGAAVAVGTLCFMESGKGRSQTGRE